MIGIIMIVSAVVILKSCFVSRMFFISLSNALLLGNPHRILDEAKSISFNATAAFNAYSNIKDYIDEADKIAKEAKGLADEATKLVRNE